MDKFLLKDYGDLYADEFEEQMTFWEEYCQALADEEDEQESE